MVTGSQARSQPPLAVDKGFEIAWVGEQNPYLGIHVLCKSFPGKTKPFGGGGYTKVRA